MKNKLKSSIRLFCGIMFLTLFSCENENIKDEHENHAHGKSPNEVSLDFFKKATKINDVGEFLKQKMNKNQAQSRMASYALTDFLLIQL